MTTEELANKKGRKFFGTSHQPCRRTEEETRKELEKIEGIKYVKIAGEASEGKKEHLQIYVEMKDQTNAKALQKRFNKVNKTFWNSPHFDFSVNPKVAITYPGNKDFVHTDGRPKGGEIFWVFEIGTPYRNDGQKDKQKGAWKERLMEMKRAIDDGHDVMYLWENYFDLMIQCGKGMRDYIRDKETAYLKTEEVAAKMKKIDSEFLATRTEIAELKRMNEMLCLQIWKLREEKHEIYELAEIQQAELERIDKPLRLY